MEIIDQKNGVPLSYYRELLAGKDPEELARRAGLPFGDGAFRLTLLGRGIRLLTADGTSAGGGAPVFDSGTSVFDDGTPAPPNVQILLLRLVTSGALAPSGGRLLAYRELPWGSVYDANFRGRCIGRLARSFGRDPQAFDRICARLGGISAGKGSWDLPFIYVGEGCGPGVAEGRDGGEAGSDSPILTVRLTLWPGDEEFPASAQFLFSDNFPAAFTAEDTAVVGDVILNTMSAMKKELA